MVLAVGRRAGGRTLTTMEDVPTPRDLRGAGAVAQSLAYVVGLAGVVAGGLLFQRGETILGIAIIVLTFAVGALMMVAAFLVRGMAGLLARLSQVESDVQVLVHDRSRPEHGPWAGH